MTDAVTVVQQANPGDNGWDTSADAWVASVGDDGDYGRRYVLDRPMLALAKACKPARVLDVGCGEGRFCRKLSDLGIATVGIDTSAPLIDHARARHPEGDYRIAPAEALPFDDSTFDMVGSYLSMIDIPDIEAAIPEMVRVLKPGGRLLIANLNGFNTAALGLGWTTLPDGRRVYAMDRYLEARPEWTQWSGIRIVNWHRPLSTYMQLLLAQGLTLTHFDEPAPEGGDPARAEHYRRAPWCLVMEWMRAG